MTGRRHRRFFAPPIAPRPVSGAKTLDEAAGAGALDDPRIRLEYGVHDSARWLRFRGRVHVPSDS